MNNARPKKTLDIIIECFFHIYVRGMLVVL